MTVSMKGNSDTTWSKLSASRKLHLVQPEMHMWATTKTAVRTDVQGAHATHCAGGHTFAKDSMLAVQP